MTFKEALQKIAERANLNATELIAYASEDKQGGRDTGYSGMSVDSVEGQLLYALVRALQPDLALEIGTCEGVSALHILTALDENGRGQLVSYDIDPNAGSAVTSKARWRLYTADAQRVDLPAADFVFEDADHGLTATITTLQKVKALGPRVVISHDYYSHEVYGSGFDVKQAFDTVFGAENVLGIRYEGAERGFGLWFNPDWEAPVEKPVKAPVSKKARK